MSGIDKAIIGMLTDIEAIGKDRECTQGARFRFRGIDDIYNAIHPLLAKHKVYPTSKVIDKTFDEREAKSGGMLRFSILTMEYTFRHEDGSSITTQVVGEAMDSGDKSCNKAMSVAYKYALFQMLCIPTEAVDPDEERHEPLPASRPAQNGFQSGDIMAQSPPKLTEDDSKYIQEAAETLRTATTERDLRALWETVKDKPGPVKAALHPIFRDRLKELAA